jgi:hypothetical protein
MRTESLGAKLLRVAWLSIVLGIAIELVLIAVAAASGTAAGAKPFVADGAQKIAWSVLVCVGLALGMTASQLRPAVSGLAGLVSAPFAFTVARAIHKSAAELLGLPPMPPSAPSPLLLAGLKGAEYAVLGVALTWIATRTDGGMSAFAAAGAAAGIVFGGAILWLSVASAQSPPPLVALFPRAANELLFPIGCAVLLYASGLLTTPFIAAPQERRVRPSPRA